MNSRTRQFAQPIALLALSTVWWGCATSKQQQGAPPVTHSSSEPFVARLHSVRSTFDSDGELDQTITYFLDGQGHEVLDGTTVWWLRGRVWRVVPYRNGKIDGMWLEYDYSGRKVLEENYVQGWRQGLRRESFSDGRPRSECLYVMDHPAGPNTFYAEKTGFPKYQEWYDDDGTIRQIKIWHQNGKLSFHGHYRGWRGDVRGNNLASAKADGKVTYWDDRGKVLAEGEFRDGQPWEGVCSTLVLPASQPVSAIMPKVSFARYSNGKIVEKLPDPTTRPDGALWKQ